MRYCSVILTIVVSQLLDVYLKIYHRYIPLNELVDGFCIIFNSNKIKLVIPLFVRADLNKKNLFTSRLQLHLYYPEIAEYFLFCFRIISLPDIKYLSLYTCNMFACTAQFQRGYREGIIKWIISMPNKYLSNWRKYVILFLK